jgi:hypothetical protein
LNPEDLVAMGVTYIDAEPDYELDEEVSLGDYDSDAVGITDYFYMKPGVQRAYQGFRSFVQGYSSVINPLQKFGYRMESAMNETYDLEDANGELIDDAIGASMQVGLRTIGAFALFRVGQNERHANGLFVPEAIVQRGFAYREEIIASGIVPGSDAFKEISDIMSKVEPSITDEGLREGLRKTIEGHPIIRAVGPYLAAIAMAGSEEAEGQLASHPDLERYRGLSRAELRELIKTERKAEQKQRRESA